MSIDHETPVSRRVFLASAGALGAGALLAPHRVLAGPTAPTLGIGSWQDGPVQQIRRAAAVEPVQVQAVRGNLHLLSGSGGNVLALAGRDGVLLVDSGIVPEKVAAAVATVSPRPIRHVINTHWHFDHTDSNAWLAERGAAIMAHDNSRKHMVKSTRVDDWNFTFPPSPRAALATEEVTADRTVRLNGAEIALRRYAPAHTDSDLAVHFTDADVMAVGDTWWSAGYPFIDYSTGGSIDGTIRAAEATIAMAGPRTLIVTGHGGVASRGDLVRYLEMLTGARAAVAALKARGMTMAQAVEAKPTAPWDPTWGRAFIDPAFFTRLVYQGV